MSSGLLQPRMMFDVTGHGDTAIFLLHGIGGNRHTWPALIDALSQAGYCAVACDLPGYGASAAVAPYTLEQVALSCLQCMDTVGARRAVLLGHSMGGMVAQTVAALAPDSIDGLVLYATSAAFGRPDGNWQRDFVRQRTAPLDAGRSMSELAQDLVARMVGPDASAQSITAAVAAMGAVPPETYRAALGALVAFDRRADLPNIAVPTLALAAENDGNAPPAVLQKMAQRIPGAEYVCLPRAGHLAHLETPAAFNAAALAFLSRHFPAAPATSPMPPRPSRFL
ncbi:alpha/beta fold hydrolase [Pandoraea sp.]|uniref:alpha/beta fold hydrolase n=1 Tax=Pandoraea sp. TaxID=1883445 RepID=UPI0012092C9D|nr:alpha/beta fold hydrolase [Pandoraea sp.]TAL55661.1 MAG: alpha/beta fold hydrolase [Pandoraea sp.]TAM16830.1 MAG: alpha/beta fold hydrolase [Pandoraea sp.]